VDEEQGGSKRKNGCAWGGRLDKGRRGHRCAAIQENGLKRCAITTLGRWWRYWRRGLRERRGSNAKRLEAVKENFRPNWEYILDYCLESVEWNVGKLKQGAGQVLIAQRPICCGQ